MIDSFLEMRHGSGLRVDREALVSVEAASGSALERLTVTEASGVSARYVVKRLRPKGDWIARATHDERMREFQLAISGIPATLPLSIGTAVEHATLLSDGSAELLMLDVSRCLSPPGDEPFTPEQTTRVVEGLARLHSTFYGFPSRLMTGIGLCTLGSWLTLLAPSTAQREAETAAPGSVPTLLRAGWDAFALLAPDAWHVIEPLLRDPSPLVSAFRECPDTFIHGDAKAGNIAFEVERLILIDWGLCARAPGAIDLGWFLAVNSAKLPTPRDEVIESYRIEREKLRRLPARGEPWERELALSLLAGTMRLGWAKALGADSEDEATRARERAEVAWWADAALRGQRWL